jgi:hypothetical protein
MSAHRSLIVAAPSEFVGLGLNGGRSALSAQPTAQPSGPQKESCGTAIYEFDLYVVRSQNLCEEFTQGDFLPHRTAVGASAIGGAGREAALRTPAERELEIPRHDERANSAILELCEHFVGICAGRLIGSSQELDGGQLLFLLVIVEEGLEPTLQFFRRTPPKILLDNDRRGGEKGWNLFSDGLDETVRPDEK